MNFKSRQEKVPGCGSLNVYTINNIIYRIVGLSYQKLMCKILILIQGLGEREELVSSSAVMSRWRFNLGSSSSSEARSSARLSSGE